MAFCIAQGHCSSRRNSCETPMGRSPKRDTNTRHNLARECAMNHRWSCHGTYSSQRSTFRMAFWRKFWDWLGEGWYGPHRKLSIPHSLPKVISHPLFGHRTLQWFQWLPPLHHRWLFCARVCRKRIEAVPVHPGIFEGSSAKLGERCYRGSPSQRRSSLQSW